MFPEPGRLVPARSHAWLVEEAVPPTRPFEQPLVLLAHAARFEAERAKSADPQLESGSAGDEKRPVARDAAEACRGGR